MLFVSLSSSFWFQFCQRYEYTPLLGEVAPRDCIVNSAKKLGEPAEFLQRKLRDEFKREDVCVNIQPPPTFFDEQESN